jgi:hypothetical protein
MLLPGLSLPAADEAAIATALKRPAEESLYPQAGAVVLLDEKIVTLHPDGTSTMEGHRLIKILQDRAMRQLSDQKIPFQGGTQSCEIITALTHLPSGETRKPEADGLMEVSDPEASNAPFYSTARLKVISFPSVQAGAVLELHYFVQPLPGQPAKPSREPFSGQAQFGGSEPVLEKSLTLRVPVGTPLQFEGFNGLGSPLVQNDGQMVQYTWTAKNQPQIVREFATVPDADLVPRLVWTVAKDRKELGRWLSGNFESAAKADATVTAKARELTEALAGPEAKVERLALFVTKEIQSVPLPLGRVGYVPTAAKTVLANRYADVRDKFALFKALLAAVGLTAEPVFVHQDHTPISRLACLSEYQGLLAKVNLASGPRFYDLMEDEARLGELMPEVAGRPALLVTDRGGEVLTTPVLEARQQAAHAQWNAKVEANGDLAARITLTFTGLFDRQVRSTFFGLNEEDRHVYFQSVADSLKSGTRLKHFTVSDLLDLTQTPTVTMDILIPDFARRQGDMMILNLPPRTLPLSDEPFRPLLSSVKYPCLVPANFTMAAELSIQLPDGYRIVHLPSTTSVRHAPFLFSLSSAQGKGELRVQRSISWREAEVEPADYAALWQAFGQTTAPGNLLVLLVKP